MARSSTALPAMDPSSSDHRNLIIKVKHGNTLKRISDYVNWQLTDQNISKLREKIISLFKFNPDVDFILKYTDEDGDLVTLDNDDELRDAVIGQRLNPFRINVELKSNTSSSTDARSSEGKSSNVNPILSITAAESSGQPIVINCPKDPAVQKEDSSVTVPIKLAQEQRENSKPYQIIKRTQPIIRGQYYVPIRNYPIDGLLAATNESMMTEKNDGKTNPGSSSHIVSRSSFPSNSPPQVRSDAVDPNTSIRSVSASQKGIDIGPNSNLRRVPTKPLVSQVLRSYGSSLVNYHKGIQCNGCGMLPIVGSRFKSKVEDDYDLCSFCYRYAKVGNDVDYIKMEGSGSGLSKDTRKPKSEPHNPSSSTPYGCWSTSDTRLGSRFVQDVTIMDGTSMAPSTNFVKIWRMENNGFVSWPVGTQLEWIGGDKLQGNEGSVDLEMSEAGFPVGGELDIAVDFIAPSKPGRYVSYWKLQSPTGQKFGQRLWVHIEVAEENRAVKKVKKLDWELRKDQENDDLDKILMELEEMGFKESKLNKKVLKLNDNDINRSVDDLSCNPGYDPLLLELEEMGFHDEELNKKMLLKNGGSLKRAVMDLVAEETAASK